LLEGGIGRCDIHLFLREGGIAVAEVDIDREGQLVESLHQDQVTGVTGLRSVERAWVEQGRGCGIHLVLALLSVVLLRVVLIILINRIGEEVVGRVLNLVSLPIDIACRLISLWLIVGEEVFSERVV